MPSFEKSMHSKKHKEKNMKGLSFLSKMAAFCTLKIVKRLRLLMISFYLCFFIFLLTFCNLEDVPQSSDGISNEPPSQSTDPPPENNNSHPPTDPPAPAVIEQYKQYKLGKTKTKTGPGQSQDCKKLMKTDIDWFMLVLGGSATDKNRSQPVLVKTG
jgi:hypothetical protein